MNNIKISVIILTYNHEKYIDQSIQSVLNQELDYNYEIIIGEDKSTDSTLKKIQEYEANYPKLIRVVSHESNVGTTQNLCDCLDVTKGEYIVLLAGDDYWIDKHKMQNQAKWLNENLQYIAVGNRINIVNNDGKFLGYFPENINKNGDYTLKDYLKCKFFPLHGLLYRNIFNNDTSYNKNKCELFNIIKSSRLIEDITLSIIIASCGNVKITEDDYNCYRYINSNDEGASNYNSLVDYSTNYHNHINLIKKISKYYPNYDFSRIYSYYTNQFLVNSILRKKYSDVLSIVFRTKWRVLFFTIYLLFQTVCKKIKRMLCKNKY